jgi:hypothetical protein
VVKYCTVFLNIYLNLQLFVGTLVAVGVEFPWLAKILDTIKNIKFIINKIITGVIRQHIRN